MPPPALTRRRFLALAGATAASSALPQPAVAAAADALPALAASLDGELVAAGHALYDSARRTASFNPRYDRYPLAMVGVRSEDDIARAIEFARRHELPLAVRSGGHDVLAASVCDAGIVVDTRFLTDVTVDDASGRVRAGAGVVAGAVNEAAGRRGRAVALGCNSQVGVSGLTLGGGIGWFVGNHGATCDQLLSARVVTVDGDLRIASRADDADLFWAIRGGGGNFGVVSEWTFASHVQPDVVCGGIVFPGELTPEFLAFYRDFLASAPDELTVEVIGNAFREPMIAAAVCYSGEPGRAAEVLRPLREFATPLADGIAVRPYAMLEAVPPDVARYLQPAPDVQEGEEPEPGSYWQGTTVAALGDEVIDAIAGALNEAPPGWSFGLGHVMRGAVTRVGPAETPLLRTPGATTVHFDAGWNYRSRAGDLMRWVDAATAATAAVSGGVPTYVNYLSESTPAAVRDSYGANYPRLARLKATYDPANVLSGNRNVRPRAADA